MSEKTLVERNAITVVVVEDHDLVRQSLAFMLEEKGFHSVLTAENGKQAVDLAKQYGDKASDNPIVMLMDIGMPVMDGITASQTIKSLCSDIKLVMLTSHQSSEDVLGAMAAGADGYCMKDISIDRLCRVIDETSQGSIWLDAAVARIVQQQWVAGGSLTPAEDASCELETLEGNTATPQRYNPNLTVREQAILAEVVNGLSNRAIAEKLSISPHTVKTHVTNIIQKMAVTDRTQAAVKAVQDGLVNPVS